MFALTPVGQGHPSGATSGCRGTPTSIPAWRAPSATIILTSRYLPHGGSPGRASALWS